MRVLFAGTPEVALPTLRGLAASAHEVAAVLTRPDAPHGRGKRLRPSPVAALAAEMGLPVLRPKTPRSAEFARQLRELAVEVCVVVAYGELLPQRLLDIPPQGWINLHFSLLPKWRGAAPVQQAIWQGDQETGATTFRLVKAMDAGPIFSQATTPLSPGATAGAVLAELSESGTELVLQTLQAIAAGAQPRAQDDSEASFAPKITAADARLDLTAPAAQLDRQIRACNPAPGAWAELNDTRFKIISAVPVPGTAKPGELLITKQAVQLGTGSGWLQLAQVQPAGKPAMAAADWARGATLGANPRLT